jgi:hypothetical protein
LPSDSPASFGRSGPGHGYRKKPLEKKNDGITRREALDLSLKGLAVAGAWTTPALMDFRPGTALIVAATSGTLMITPPPATAVTDCPPPKVGFRPNSKLRAVAPLVHQVVPDATHLV